jgi:hypothetical protein
MVQNSDNISQNTLSIIVTVSIILTVATNIFVTSLIAFRLLRARRKLADVLPSADVSLYTGVMAILIESAAPLTVFGIVSAIMQQLSSARIYKSPEFYACGASLQALFYAFCVSPDALRQKLVVDISFKRDFHHT